jgi:hypothetical protein
MPINLLTLSEVEALGIPRVTWVIGSVPGRKSGKSAPSATAPTIAGGGGHPASAQLQAMRDASFVEEDAQSPKDRPRQARITAARRKALKCPAPAI